MHRRLFLLIGDLVLLVAAGYASIPIVCHQHTLGNELYYYGIAAAAFQIAFLFFSGTYRWSFRHANMSEFFSLVLAIMSGAVGGYLLAIIFGDNTCWPFFIVQFLMSVLFISTFRFSYRFKAVLFYTGGKDMKRALIVGAGEAGESIVRKMKQTPAFGYRPVAFVDDNKRKHGIRIRGLTVFGGIDMIPAVVERYEVDEIIITIPSAEGEEIRRIISFCEKTKAHVKILPGIWEIILGDAHLHQIREVRPEDLLGRETVRIDVNQVKGFYQGKTVLVTGACGSIGSELVEQLKSLPVRRIIAVDRNENEMYFLHYENKKLVDESILVPVLADCTQGDRMRTIFDLYRPQIVFHAAAYKHVPLMESYPREAVRNNIGTTGILINCAAEFDVQHFVLISTDKAVRPKNIMGYTKRIAELMVLAKNKHSATCCCAVRFGNVLGSNGSIIPILKRQIARGGPVTVTSPDAKRYFMIIPEAVQLILQAAVLTKGGETFVLDMGEQVRIDDLARDVIRLMGYVPDKDIAIEYTGLRPGEKLEEELFEDRRNLRSTAHEKILMLTNGIQKNTDHIIQHVTALEKSLEKKEYPVDQVREMLANIVRNVTG